MCKSKAKVFIKYSTDDLIRIWKKLFFSVYWCFFLHNIESFHQIAQTSALSHPSNEDLKPIKKGEITVNVSDKLPKPSNILTTNIEFCWIIIQHTVRIQMHMPKILHSQGKTKSVDRIIIIINNLFPSLLLYHSCYAF